MTRPEHERADPRPLAVVFRTHSDIEASIVVGLLEAHGIVAGRRRRTSRTPCFR